MNKEKNNLAELDNLKKDLLSINLSDQELNMCQEMINQIDELAIDLEEKIKKNPLSFDYLTALEEVNNKKFEISLTIRNYVE